MRTHCIHIRTAHALHTHQPLGQSRLEHERLRPAATRRKQQAGRARIGGIRHVHAAGAAADRRAAARCAAARCAATCFGGGGGEAGEEEVVRCQVDCGGCDQRGGLVAREP